MCELVSLGYGDVRRSLKYPSVVLKVLVLFCLLYPAHSLRRISTLNLASMRIGTAAVQLKDTGGRAGAVLEEHCRLQLAAVQGTLRHSSKQILVNPDEARRDLVTVENFLHSCSQNLSSILDSQAYNLLSRVEQSVASAENLIDQSEISEHLPNPQETAIDSEATEEEWAPLISSRVENDRQSRQAGMTSMSTLGPFPIPPKVHMPMSELVVDFCSNHVDLTLSSAIIRLDRSCGGKFHTPAKYSSGVFTIRMRAPSGAPGLSNSFYISSNDGSPDVISFDFVGNEPRRVLTAYAVNGDHDHKLKTFHMDFDTTLGFHDYTIKWDDETIVWMVDDVVLRTLRASRARAYPAKPGHVFGYSWDASSIADGKLAGRINWNNAPFLMRYENLQVTSPLRSGEWRPPQASRVTKGLTATSTSIRPLVIDYCPWNVATEDDLDVEIAFDRNGCGGRVRSLNVFRGGEFSARIKCAEGDTSGLLTSFYLSSGEGSATQDEIDFEFLGDNKRIVQTNFWVNGTSGNEQWTELGFDCSSGFHTYTIHYDQERIQWFVDSRLVRTVVKAEQLRKQEAYPVKKGYLYQSVWNASHVNDGGWTGRWHGMGDVPFVAKFKDVTARLTDL